MDPSLPGVRLKQDAACPAEAREPAPPGGYRERHPRQGGTLMAIDETVHQHKYLLDEDEMPTAWYNIVPDLP